MTSNIDEFIKGDRFAIPFVKIGSPRFAKTEQRVEPYKMPLSSIFSDNSRERAYNFCKCSLGKKEEWENILGAIEGNHACCDQAEVDAFGKWLLGKMEDPDRSAHQKKHIAIVLRDVAGRVSSELRTKIITELVFDDL